MIHEIEPLHFDNQYHGERRPDAQSVVLHYIGRNLLCHIEDGVLSFPHYADFAPDVGQFVYLFDVEGTDYFILRHDGELDLSGYTYSNISFFGAVTPRENAFVVLTGFHLSTWYSANRYCGCCGTPTEHDNELRMLRCPNCGNMIFPKITPSVIVGVINNDRLLLTRYNRPGSKLTAMIAGFTEIGESIEQNICREVYEEVGIRVKNLRYYKSQPWGISGGGLLLGFWCEADGDPTLKADGVELAEARWLTREELRETYHDNGISLTGEMTQAFIDGKHPYRSKA